MDKADENWNAFIDRAIEKAPQRPSEKALYALFFYQAEVNNGGHHQYFYNWPSAQDWDQALSGAREIGQTQVAEILAQSIKRWTAQSRPRHENIDTFMEEARQLEFEDADTRFYALDTAFQIAFENHINKTEGL